MYLANLPLELLLQITSGISDPCDLKSLYSVNKRLYFLLLPIFTERYSYLKGGATNILDYRISDLSNWCEHLSTTPEPLGDDPASTLTTRRKYLEYSNLAIRATQNGWSRLVRSLVRNHNVRGSGTVILRKFANARGIYYRKRWDRYEISILELAARQNNYELVKFMLDHGHGVDPDCFSEYPVPGFDSQEKLTYAYTRYKTPLASAVLNNNIAIASLLLERGANTELCDLGRRTPVMTAVKCKHVEVLETLLKAGAHACTYEAESEDDTLLVAAGSWNNPPSYEIMRLLVKYYRSIDYGSYDGPPLHVVLDGLHSSLYGSEGLPVRRRWREEDEKIIRMLCEAGSDLSLNDRNGRALDIAAKWGLMEAAEILMEYGANPLWYSEEAIRKDAIQLAREAGFENLARKMEKHVQEVRDGKKTPVALWLTTRQNS